jgi:hypothetical protein
MNSKDIRSLQEAYLSVKDMQIQNYQQQQLLNV